MDLLLKSTNSSNWYDIMRGLLNTWEFLFLYGIIETTLKSILSMSGAIREEELVSKVYEKFSGLEQEIGISKLNICSLWELYTELRNTYAHSHGLITDLAKSNIGGKLDKARNSLYDICGILSLTKVENIFKNDKVQKNKFYFMSDEELNIFRNIIIHLMESIDSVCMNQNP